jgi:sulfate transport system permease protein
MTRRIPRGPSRWIAGAVLAWLMVLLVVPLAALAFTVASAPLPTVAALIRPEAIAALQNTLIVAGLCVVLNGVFGVVTALALVRWRHLGHRALDAVIDLPLSLSPVMTGLAFLLMFGRGGWAAPLVDAIGIPVAFAFPALLFATLFVTLPFTAREVALVLEAIGDSEEQAAATLGASPWQTFWKVTLPNVRHALGVGSTLTLARALGEFGAVLVVGGAIRGKTETATTFVHAALEARAEPAAYGMALLLAAAAMATMALRARLESHR